MIFANAHLGRQVTEHMILLLMFCMLLYIVVWIRSNFSAALVDGVRHASAVFTREFSDWSTMNDLSNDGPVWWRAVRTKDSLELLCSLDGKKYASVRQGYLVPGRAAEVGVMCASPEGSGFEATFEGLKLSVAMSPS